MYIFTERRKLLLYELQYGHIGDRCGAAECQSRLCEYRRANARRVDGFRAYKNRDKVECL